MNQNKAPIYEALLSYAKKKVTKLHVPGHCYGRGLPEKIAALLGKSAEFDLSVLEDIDSLSHPQSSIKEAQELAAELFGAKETLFLVNGSTLGVLAMILSTCSLNDKILISRNMHQSIMAGLILSGAKPVYFQPEFDEDFNLPLNVKPETIEKSLKENPDAKAVLIINPTQFGIAADIEKIAKIVHKAGKILLVDEAWGAHFKFHPEFPASAMEAGADLAVQSVHKRLPALSQTSMLHIGSGRIDSERVKNTVRMLQTTSPSYIFLASMDSARRQMALSGEKLWQKPIGLAKEARDFLKKSKFRYLSRNYLHEKGFDLDLTMLTVEVENGFEAWKILNKNKIEPEFGTLNHLVFIFGIGNDKKDAMNFKNALKHAAFKKNKRKIKYPQIVPQIFMSPCEVSLKETEEIKIDKSIGRISAQLIVPYPPGIPLLAPGEKITKEILDYLNEIVEYSSARMQILGANETIKVIK